MVVDIVEVDLVVAGLEVVAGIGEDVEATGSVVVVLCLSLLEVKCTTVGITMMQISVRLRTPSEIFLFLFTADINRCNGFLTL